MSHFTREQLQALRAIHARARLPQKLRYEAHCLAVVTERGFTERVADCSGSEENPTERTVARAALVIAAVNALPMLISDLLEADEARAKAEHDYAACAEAIGVEYAPDTGPTAPGPVEAVVAAIREAARARDQLLDDLDTNVVKICPCQTKVEVPGPHIPECPFSDMEYEPGKTPTQYVEWGEYRATREIGIWLLSSDDPVRRAIGEELRAGKHKEQ